MISASSKKVLKNKFLCESLPKQNKPTLFAMAGIPGSGKSTFVARQQKNGNFPTDVFVLNPDIILNALDDYHILYDQEGAEKAFDVYDIPCRDLSYDFFSQAVSRKLDIIKDMNNARRENVEKIQQLKREGYYIKMFFMYADIEVALKRITQRNRHTPEEMVRERAASLKNLVMDLMAVADEFVAYDNSTDGFDEISSEELLALLEKNY